MAVKLLVIDDNINFLRGLRRFLDTQPSVDVVGELTDGNSVLEKIQQLQPNVVITDIAMPDVSGLKIINEIQNSYPHIGIVALTMYDNQEYRQGALQAGAHDFVIKSELKDKLLAAILDAYEITTG